MRLEELKNEMPKTPDFIHSMIQEEVNKQMKETTQILINLYKKSIEDQKMLMKTKSGLEFLIAEQHMRFLYNQLQAIIEQED